MRELTDLVARSRDLHGHGAAEPQPVLDELRQSAFERRADPVDGDEIARFNASRRRFLASGVAAGLFAGTVGSALGALAARPAAADTALDIQILQTASAVETASVAAYQAVLGLDFIKTSEPALLLFLQTTSNQHGEHAVAFRAQTAALGGPEQPAAHPALQQLVNDAMAGATTELAAIRLMEQIETIATHTYLDATAQLDDTVSRQLMATVMGVESQHAGMLRVVAALLGADSPELIAIPVDPASLPSAIGSVATPDAVEPATNALQPASGVAAPVPDA